MAGEKHAFARAYARLNDAQKRAVDLIDGPVMVVAGPGTGKTQLLSLRVGNILRGDSTMLPSNILCLTFTDAAASNMRERLIGLIGQAAYQVAIHTFNSFGAWIMTTYPEYFFAWREAGTADELTQYRVLEAILEKLPGNHVLAAQSFDGTFFALRQLQNLIQDCKRANLSALEVRKVLDANQAVYDKLTPILNEHWPASMRQKGALAKIQACIHTLEKAKVTHKPPVDQITTIDILILQELHAAQAKADQLPPNSQSQPFTAWKNNWLALDSDKKYIFKASQQYEKLCAATEVYKQYQRQLRERGLVDFNDQIMAVLAALERHDELRWNLQERFQYVMIDEYQDTNRSQLQLAKHITDAPVHEGRPNILVVGDDDQAIYRFQGADMSNIGEFEAAYRQPTIIALQENYRSTKAIMGSARAISTQIEFSLEKQKGISKEPIFTNRSSAGTGVQLHEFKYESDHYAWIANKVQQTLQKDGKSSAVAVLARERAQLDALVPYLRSLNLPMDYERRENVLEQEQIVVLLTVARLVCALAEQRLDDADELLPKVLSHPMWGIESKYIWHVARQAYESKKFWFDVIFAQKATRLRQVADFLFGLGQQASSAPFEQVFDALVGISEPDNTIQGDSVAYQSAPLVTSFVSPFKSYYFGDELLDTRPARYLTMLSHLACLRRNLRTAQDSNTEMLRLHDVIAFVDAFKRAGLVMLDTAVHREDGQAVQLMTVHKAKGLEFGTVFVIGLQDRVWDKNKAVYARLSYPRNLTEIKPSDNVADDGLRLLFVAITRARQNLHLCHFKQSEDDREQQPYAPLLELPVAPDRPQTTADLPALVTQHEERWLSRHASLDHASKRALLGDRLARYRLSATHLNNFLDVSRGGPLYFLTQDLLHFPATPSPAAAYGIAMHEALRRAHELVIAGSHPSTDQIVQIFKASLQTQALSEHDRVHYLHQGEQGLQAYLKSALDTLQPAQKVELNFADQGVMLGEARLSGKLDLLDFDQEHRSVIVSDYKTGRAYGSWELPRSAEEYERIKLHLWRRQLLFYKLLVDGSDDWGNRGWRATSGVLRFIEPDAGGNIRTLSLAYDPGELTALQQLIASVWRYIMALKFPDTTSYGSTLAGMKQFEQDILHDKI